LEKFFGISIDKIKAGIENFVLSKNRMEIQKIKGITIVNDCYNANFDSMKAAIESVSNIEGRRKIAVLGDMLELGSFSKQLHDKVGIEVAKNQIDVLITVGKEAKTIAKSAIKAQMDEKNIYCFEENRKAIQLLKEIIEEGDVILIKASNGMKFIEIVNEVIHDIENK